MRSAARFEFICPAPSREFFERTPMAHFGGVRGALEAGPGAWFRYIFASLDGALGAPYAPSNDVASH